MKNNNDKIQKELTIIESYIKGEPRLKELFLTLPTATIEVYNLTTENYASKQYDDINSQNKIIPHGFYGLLELSIRKNGILQTLKTYNHEIKLIAETMNMETKDLITLIKDIKDPLKESLPEHNRRLKSQAELKEIIRKFTSKYKESYIKSIIAERKKALQPHITFFKKSKVKYSIEDFINYILKSKSYNIEIITSYIARKFNIELNETQLEELIKASFTPNYMESIEQVLNTNISKPHFFDYFKANKTCNRLKHNYESKLNNQLANCSNIEKEAIYKIILYRTKIKRAKINEESLEFIALKALVHSANLNLAEEISTIMSKCEDCKVILENGTFIFDVPKILTKEERADCIAYTRYLKSIKGIHNIIQKEYAYQKNQLQLLVDNSESFASQNQENYTIDITPWFKHEKIKELLLQINTLNINILSEKEFAILKDLLLNKGLLWAYISGNIETSTISVIINNFQYIVKYCQIDKLTNENLNEIIRKAYLYVYADDILIGLIGPENVSKIINYNQFLGVPITNEIIRKRLNSILDLAVRSERYQTSSLPFDCNVTLGNYTLSRYYNNDPKVFISGIETKTCFFVSVNENDFFIYSLLSKDGYVIKITNDKGELVARASCFRRNNILMINGIRWKNNKVIPENQEEFTEILQITNLVKLMAKKLINMTKDDDCPIDYVVCNRAGILENPYFEGAFEVLNPILFHEPINVYDDEWQRFIHLYDDAEEQFLQEAPYNPNHSFTTDFGDHYPALLIASRDNRALVRPFDISRNDQPDTYIRPRHSIKIYMKDEITEEILNRINRLRALSCFIGPKEEIQEKRYNYRLITNIENIESVILGDDWVILNYVDNIQKVFYAKENILAINEVAKFITDGESPTEQGVKLYHILRKQN